MGVLSLILLIPLAWPFVAKALWKHEITLAEMGINLGVGVLVAVVGYMASLHIQALDTEIHNGVLVSKASERVSCEHSYQCRCRETCSGSGSSKSCSTTCDTCYEHAYDVDWNLNSDIGVVNVARVDRRGLQEPPRFTRAQAGDPVSLARSYQNYIKAAPDSLFNASVQQFLLTRYEGKIPSYPDTVYDYHYVNRVLAQGISVPELTAWNNDLARLLSRLGPRKQVNVVIVFTKEADPQYAEALRAAWLGGKKNDVVVVFGVPEYPKIGWARIVSWTDKELFKVQLRDALQSMETLDRPLVMNLLDEHISGHFVRKSMKDFEYLKNEATPPTWLAALLAVLAAAASIGLSVYLSRNQYRGFSGGQSFRTRFPPRVRRR